MEFWSLSKVEKIARKSISISLMFVTVTLGGKINLGRGVPPIMAIPKRRGVFSGMAALGHLKVMFDQL